MKLLFNIYFILYDTPHLEFDATGKDHDNHIDSSNFLFEFTKTSTEIAK